MTAQKETVEPEPPEPGTLTRSFTRVMHIVGTLGAWRFRAKRPVTNVQQQISPGRAIPAGKAIDASFTDYLSGLKGKKEVLMAFYANEDVLTLPCRCTYRKRPLWKDVRACLERLANATMNENAVIVFCKYQRGEKLPFKIHKFPTIKLLKLKPTSRNTAFMEYFGDPTSLEGYFRFVKEEGSVPWFAREPNKVEET